MSARTAAARLAAGALGLVLLAGCGSSADEPAAAAPTASAAGCPAAADAAPTTVVAGDPAVPPLGGSPGDLGAAPVVEPGTGAVPEGLVLSDVVEGTGAVAGADSTVDVRYVGTLYEDGTVFDSSWRRGDAPITFPLAGVVPGFATGIEGMAVGGRREIVIPPALGYGERANGPIPACSTLVFVVDLVGVS